MNWLKKSTGISVSVAGGRIRTGTFGIRRGRSLCDRRLLGGTIFGEPRFTNNIDILGEFDQTNLPVFLLSLLDTFYVDDNEALAAIRRGRSFNIIYRPAAFKFDFFPASAFALGSQELDRAAYVSDTGLAKAPAPFVTPEDIVLAKLFWYRSGGNTSEVQWRDLKGIARNYLCMVPGIPSTLDARNAGRGRAGRVRLRPKILRTPGEKAIVGLPTNWTRSALKRDLRRT